MQAPEVNDVFEYNSNYEYLFRDKENFGVNFQIAQKEILYFI